MSEKTTIIENEELLTVIENAPEFAKSSLLTVIDDECRKNYDAIEKDKARILEMCAQMGEDNCYLINHCVSPTGTGYFCIRTEKLLSDGTDITRYVDSSYTIESIGAAWSVYTWLHAAVYDELLFVYLSWLSECVSHKNPRIRFDIKRLYYPFVSCELSDDVCGRDDIRTFVEKYIRPYTNQYRAQYGEDAEKTKAFPDWRTYYNGGEHLHDFVDTVLLSAESRIFAHRAKLQDACEWDRAEEKMALLREVIFPHPAV